MNKKYLLIIHLVFFTVSFSQIKLSETNFNNLVAIGEYYSSNVMLTQKTAVEDLEKLRTKELTQIIDVLQVISKQSIDIIDRKYLKKPTYEDLVMWFVIREIHYNLTNDEKKPNSSVVVAKEYLSKKIDNRWLIDNYYFRIQGTVAMLFNEVDFSTYNFDLENYELETEFEKSALYFNLLHAFTTRFKVLQYMKNNKKLIEFADKMPTFNGRKYYYFTKFNYPDFEWIGYDKKEMYNDRNIGNLYEILIAHINAVSDLKRTKEVNEIFNNSIMFVPKYFKYSGIESDLKKIYKKKDH